MQRFVRVLAAALLLAGGAIHLDLWRGGYEGIPYVGPLFLANVVLSAVVALALAVWGGRLSLVAGANLAIGSLVGLVLSRTVGLLGFMEAGWTPDALRAVAAETGALVTLGLVVAVGWRRNVPAPVPVLARR